MGYLDFYHLPEKEKLKIFGNVEYNTGLPGYAVEKDWWVVRTLDVIFHTDIKDHLVFKGGTSLSKAWELISRFSEDIDLALDRSFLGFNNKKLGRSAISRLQKTSHKYVLKDLIPQLIKKFESFELEVEIRTGEINSADQDPLILEIYYPSITKATKYIQPRVLVEIGCRSLREPFSLKTIQSDLGGEYAETELADEPINIPTVHPERTFLEKLFLLHEEFHRPPEKVRVDRLSRHLYDIHQISKSEYAEKAINDLELYSGIVEHRSIFSKVGGVDYKHHFPPNLNPIPPDDQLDAWKNDYATMQSQMIYGESVSFEELIESVKKITEKINKNSQ